MNKGTRVLVVLTFLLVLAMAGFLLWQNLKGPTSAVKETAEPGIERVTSLEKTEGQWVMSLEAKYQELAGLLNDKKWDKVAAFYGEDVVLESKGTNEVFHGGGKIADEFWKKMFENNPKLKVVGFKIEIERIFLVNFPACLLGRAERVNQCVIYRGKYITTASPEVSRDFMGVAGHIQSCPDIILGEIY